MKPTSTPVCNQTTYGGGRHACPRRCRRRSCTTPLQHRHRPAAISADAERLLTLAFPAHSHVIESREAVRATPRRSPLSTGGSCGPGSRRGKLGARARMFEARRLQNIALRPQLCLWSGAVKRAEASGASSKWSLEVRSSSRAAIEDIELTSFPLLDPARMRVAPRRGVRVV